MEFPHFHLSLKGAKKTTTILRTNTCLSSVFFWKTYPSVKVFTSSSGTCAPAAAPRGAAAAPWGAPGRMRGAAAGRRHRAGGPGGTGASPPGPAL